MSENESIEKNAVLSWAFSVAESAEATEAVA
jgi:hypothetical protein